MLRSVWLENPILAREMRTRMRGSRPFWLLFAYVAILAAILFVTYLFWWNSVQGDLSSGRNGAAGGASQVGKIFYSTLFTVQAIMIGIITPSLTAGGISIEKEQRTFDLLTVSLMPRRSIVIGKLISALAFVALLLTASLPLISLSFLLGGVSPSEVISAYALLLVTAFLYGTVGIACSSVAKNTTSSTVMTYGAIIVIFFTTLPLSVVAVSGTMAPGLTSQTGIGLSALNPIGALTAGTITEIYFGIGVPAWLTALVINGLLGIIFTLVAIHRLDYPRTDRSGWLRLLTAIFVGLLAFCVYGMFLSTGATYMQNTGPFIVALATLLGLIPLVPLFTTADSLPEPGGIWGIINPLRLGRGEAPSGILYVMLLVVLSGVVLFSGMIFGNTMNGTVSSIVLNDTTVGQLLLLSLSTVWGFGSLGVFCSALTRNRWSALGLVTGLMVILYLIPLTASGVRASSNETPTIWDNGIYLSPLAGGVDIAGRATGEKIWDWAHPALFFHSTPLAYVTSGLYIFLGILFLIGGALLHQRYQQRRWEARKADGTSYAPESPAGSNL